MRRIAFGIVLFVFIFSNSAFAEEGKLAASQIVEKSLQAFYYTGKDMKARINMTLVDKNDKRRKRIMTLLRLNQGDNGNQKYFIYFHKPGDVRGMTFMVWKLTKKDDKRWIYIPAVDLVKRIAADDKRSSFVGSDFTYEDISGRDVTVETHTLLRTESLDGKECYVIESIPQEIFDYSKRLSWIDKEDFIPQREEYYDVQDALYKVFTAEKTEIVDGLPTVTQRTMTNVKTKHRTNVSYESTLYNQGLKEKDFSERHLRKPPRSWIK